MKKMTILVSILLAVALALPATSFAGKGDNKKAAAAKWGQANTQYELGRFEAAIELFKAAYELHNYEDILYNLAQAHRQLKKYKQALFYYRAYLRHKKDPPNEEQVRDLTEKLERLVKEQEATSDRPPLGATAPTKAEPATVLGTKTLGPNDTRPPNYGPYKWLTLVTGGAAAITGGVLVAVHCTNSGNSQCSSVNDTRTTGFIVAATGGALLATSAILFVFDAKAKKKSRTHAAILPTDGGAMFTLSGSF